MNPPNHQSLRLTPSNNSPFQRNPSPRSPVKTGKSEEPGLRLKKIIGTTTTSANGFDCLPHARQFAYTAGAAAVVSTLDAHLNITQRFFRAKPSFASASTRDNVSQASPTPQELRNRITGAGREQTPGASPLGGRDWSDSPIGKTATAKDKVKAVTSVALSPNGKWVAVGETGYKPRVLIFANKSDCNETPVCALAEHTFGVHALAFGPDSSFLASLGTVNDGYLFLWSIDDRSGAASLHSSNKCTVHINNMTWLGRSLLMVGVRFAKVWRPDEEPTNEDRGSESSNSSVPLVNTPKQKGSEYGNGILTPRFRVLHGKNVILADMLQSTFVVALALSNDKAVLCSEVGDICVLDDYQKSLHLTPVAKTSFRVHAASLDQHGRLHVCGNNDGWQTFDTSKLVEACSKYPSRGERQTVSPTRRTSHASTAAMAIIDSSVVQIDSGGSVKVAKLSPDHDGLVVDEAPEFLSANTGALVGVRNFRSESLPEASFLTFSRNGSVQTWDSEGKPRGANLVVPAESSPELYDIENELKAAAPMTEDGRSLLAAGDRYGTLTILEMLTGTVTAHMRAHSAEMVDLVAFTLAGAQYVATAGRDRTVQLFLLDEDRTSLELLQTMDEHAAALTGLLVTHDGDFLLSCSSDRSVVVREKMFRDGSPDSLAFAITRTITLRASPTAMCIGATRDDILVATLDRSVAAYNLRTGRCGFGFKCSDVDGGEATTLSRIQYAPALNGAATIVGVSSADKSVRLYSEYGSLIARDWGHTEGITDLTLLAAPHDSSSDPHTQETHTHLVTVALDSTIFLWDTRPPSSPPHSRHPSPPNSETPTPTLAPVPARPPRKVLSQSDLARLRRAQQQNPSNTNTDTPPDPATSPTAKLYSPSHPPSPQPQSQSIADRAPAPHSHRLRKPPSRASLAHTPTPRLDPAFRSQGYGTASRRRQRGDTGKSDGYGGGGTGGGGGAARRGSAYSGSGHRSPSPGDPLSPPPPLPRGENAGASARSPRKLREAGDGQGRGQGRRVSGSGGSGGGGGVGGSGDTLTSPTSPRKTRPPPSARDAKRDHAREPNHARALSRDRSPETLAAATCSLTHAMANYRKQVERWEGGLRVDSEARGALGELGGEVGALEGVVRGLLGEGETGRDGEGEGEVDVAGVGRGGVGETEMVRLLGEAEERIVARVLGGRGGGGEVTGGVNGYGHGYGNGGGAGTGAEAGAESRHENGEEEDGEGVDGLIGRVKGLGV